MTLVEQRKARCLGCQYLCEQGCLRGNHLPFPTREEHLKYYGGDGGMTVRLTKDGIAVYLVDIKWCDFWKQTPMYRCKEGYYIQPSEVLEVSEPDYLPEGWTVIPPIMDICAGCKMSNSLDDIEYVKNADKLEVSTISQLIKECDLDLVDVVVFDSEKK